MSISLPIDPVVLNDWVDEGVGKASTLVWRLEVETVKIKGKRRYLWKAVDEAGELLDFYATDDRDEAVARQFFEQALKYR